MKELNRQQNKILINLGHILSYQFKDRVYVSYSTRGFGNRFQPLLFGCSIYIYIGSYVIRISDHQSFSTGIYLINLVIDKDLKFNDVSVNLTNLTNLDIIKYIKKKDFTLIKHIIYEHTK